MSGTKYYNVKSVFYNVLKLYFCDGNADFSESLIQSLVSHDP